MIKLFCLPYAGGSAAVFSRWKGSLNGMIQLQPIELAGRGKRFSDANYDSLLEAVDDIYGLIKPELDRALYAFWGHSMGSLLIYELVRKIETLPHPKPIHLFLSGSNPPHIKKDGKIFHTMPEDRFKEEIFKMGGTPREVFEHRELLKIFLPLLRADYKILETYEHKSDHPVFDCAITLFNGKADEEVTGAEILKWQQYTKQPCRLYEYEGGHFFINDYMEDIIQIINDTLIQAILHTETGSRVFGI
jgi:medium-chain acyl-[acyl-carrier-protein] hydrolase